MVKGIDIDVGAVAEGGVDGPGSDIDRHDFLFFLLLILGRISAAHGIGYIIAVEACVAFQLTDDALGRGKRRVNKVKSKK